MATNSTIYGTESIMLGYVNKLKRGKEPVRFLSPFCLIHEAKYNAFGAEDSGVRRHDDKPPSRNGYSCKPQTGLCT